MEDPLGRVAAGLILEAVLAEKRRCPVFVLDPICDDTVKHLASMIITMPDTYRRWSLQQVRKLVLAELNNLFRRGMLQFASEDGDTWLAIRVREGVAPTVDTMLKDLRQ